MLAAAERSALLTVTHYSASSSTETAELSADIVLAGRGDRLYVFTRHPEHPERLASQGLNDDEVLELIRSLAVPSEEGDAKRPTAESQGRIAKLRTTIMRRLRRDKPATGGSAR